MFDQDRRGRAIIVGADGSLYVTGGQGRAPIAFSVTFSNFWIARFSSAGEPQWEQIDLVEEESQSNGLSIALSPDGTLTSVATIFDGSDTPVLRRYTSSGEPLGQFSVEPGITQLATSPSGELIAAGSNLVEFRDGRPFTELWVGGLEGDEISWQRTLRGVDGSISTAWDLAVTSESTFVAGSQGTAQHSNASDPWLGAGPLQAGEFNWDVLPVLGGGNGRSVSVAAAPDGGVVVVGDGATPFVHRYADDGRAEWKRALDAIPTAVAATAEGYAIGYDFDGVHVEAASGRIDFFDWDGTRVWRFEDPACERVGDLISDDGDLVALLDCGYSLGLFRIPIDQRGMLRGDTRVAALRACGESSDCQPGHSCVSGTCATDCVEREDCPLLFWNCFAEKQDESDCPLLGDGDVENPHVCLPQCTVNEDCTKFAPGLRCRNAGCVIELPECEQRCAKLLDGCSEGCGEIFGRRFDAERGCFSLEDELLGCAVDGRASTADAGCVISPGGVLYLEGGLAKQILTHNFGFRLCTIEESQMAFDLPSCDD
jgi:hypothetical protein